MDVIGVIPARYASTRLPGKVLVDLCGKTMLQRVWERAKRAKYLDELLIACDDERVAAAARGFGGRPVMTSVNHSCGTDRIAEVISPLDVRIVINIQADEPLLEPVMIDQLAHAMLDDKEQVMATLVKRIDDAGQAVDPNVVKVILDRGGNAIYFSRAAVPYRAANSEITAASYYKHIGMYAYTKDFLFTYKNMPQSLLERTEKLEQLRVIEAGYRIKAVETSYDVLSVDTPEDADRVRALITGGCK